MFLLTFVKAQMHTVGLKSGNCDDCDLILDFQLLSWLSDCSLKVNRINSLIKQVG